MTMTGKHNLPVRHVFTSESCLSRNIFSCGLSPVSVHGYVTTKGVTISLSYWTCQVKDCLSEFGRRHGTDNPQYLKKVHK